MEVKKQGNVFYVKSDHQIYYVTLKPINCSCPDFKYRKDTKGEFCKHIWVVIKEQIKEVL